jgi:hypothetical protein
MSRGLILNRKQATNTKVDGVSKSGEISPKGTVKHIEDWEGRVAVEAGPPTQHYVYFKSTGELRRKTLQELIDEGKFYVGHGPTGLRVRS